MKIRTKKGVKINSQEGDITSEGQTIDFIIGELIIPEGARKEAKEAGIRDAEKMYLRLISSPDEPLKLIPSMILDYKVDISDNIEEMNLHNEDVIKEIEDILKDCKAIGFITY